MENRSAPLSPPPHPLALTTIMIDSGCSDRWMDGCLFISLAGNCLPRWKVLLLLLLVAAAAAGDDQSDVEDNVGNPQKLVLIQRMNNLNHQGFGNEIRNFPTPTHSFSFTWPIGRLG